MTLKQAKCLPTRQDSQETIVQLQRKIHADYMPLKVSKLKIKGVNGYLDLCFSARESMSYV